MSISKTGLLTINDFIEKGYQFNTSSGWSYTPGVDAENRTTSGMLITLTPFQTLKKPLKLYIELDLTWGNFTGSGTAGTFRFNFQGAQQLLDGTEAWQGTNYITSALQSQHAPINSVNANLTGGSYHYSTSTIIPASWFDTYQGSRLAFRVDYCRGGGSVTVSNVKVTFDSSPGGPCTTSIGLEYAAAGQFYEY